MTTGYFYYDQEWLDDGALMARDGVFAFAKDEVLRDKQVTLLRGRGDTIYTGEIELDPIFAAKPTAKIAIDGQTVIAGLVQDAWQRRWR